MLMMLYIQCFAFKTLLSIRLVYLKQQFDILGRMTGTKSHVDWEKWQTLVRN